MRTLSQQEMTAVSGGFFLFCAKPKKPKCIKLPKPPKHHGCNPKPPCGEPETPEEPDPVDPAPAG